MDPVSISVFQCCSSAYLRWEIRGERNERITIVAVVGVFDLAAGFSGACSGDSTALGVCSNISGLLRKTHLIISGCINNNTIFAHHEHHRSWLGGDSLSRLEGLYIHKVGLSRDMDQSRTRYKFIPQ